MQVLPATKRMVDIVVGSLLVLLALPLMIALAVGVAIALRAWPIFHHTRPGMNGRTVHMIKLRTLPTSTPRYGNKHVLGIDAMPLPWLCRKLRATHLDELPQLLLVVVGQMSLVGPRPRLPEDVEPVAADYDAARTSVRPGCTGLWQLSVAANETSTSAPRFDLFYLENASLRFDVWILVRTIGWVLGLVKPIEVSDVPAYVKGPGLVDFSRVRTVAPVARPVSTIDLTDIEPLGATVALRSATVTRQDHSILV